MPCSPAGQAPAALPHRVRRVRADGRRPWSMTRTSCSLLLNAVVAMQKHVHQHACRTLRSASDRATATTSTLRSGDGAGRAASSWRIGRLPLHRLCSLPFFAGSHLRSPARRPRRRGVRRVLRLAGALLLAVRERAHRQEPRGATGCHGASGSRPLCSWTHEELNQASGLAWLL